MRSLALTMTLAMAVMPAASQTPAQKPAFEVASVKRNTAGRSPGVPVRFLPGGRFVANHATLVDVIVQVYGTRRIQLKGGPNWIDSELFDIDAKAEDPNAGLDRMRQMVQRLLEDRFQLRLHVENMEVSTYVLVLGKDRPNLQDAQEGEKTDVFRGDRGQMIFTRSPIAGGLVNVMSNLLHTPVVDGTGLKGFYHFTVDPSPFMTAAGDSYDYGNAFVAAVQEQLGFKLEKRKELLDITVIDHAEKPDAN